MENQYAVARGNIIEFGSTLLFPLQFGRGLASISDLSSSCKIEAVFYDEEISIVNDYTFALGDGNKVILLPRENDNIAVVDIINKNIKRIPLINRPGEVSDWRKKARKFSGAYRCGKIAIFPGRFYPAVVFMDMDNNELRYETSWKKEYSNNGYNMPFFSSGAVIMEEEIILSFYNEPKVLKSNLRTGSVAIEQLKIPLKEVHNITSDGGKVYITGLGEKTEECYFGDTTFSYFEKIDLPEDGIPNEFKGKEIYCEPIFFDDEIFLIPIMGKNAYRISKKSHHAEVCRELGQAIDKSRENQECYMIANHVKDDSIIFSISGRREWFRYNINDRTIQKKMIMLPEDFWRHEKMALQTKNLGESLFIKEKEGDLEIFISVI